MTAEDEVPVDELLMLFLPKASGLNANCRKNCFASLFQYVQNLPSVFSNLTGRHFERYGLVWLCRKQDILPAAIGGFDFLLVR